MPSARRYQAQIEGMIDKGRAWVNAHPEALVEVRFDFAPEALVIAPISSAIKAGLVKVNDAGRELLHAMQEGTPEMWESTVTMVRVALEIVWVDGKAVKS